MLQRWHEILLMHPDTEALHLPSIKELRQLLTLAFADAVHVEPCPAHP